MKRVLTALVFLASVSVFTIIGKADERWETLRAINYVENPTNHTRVGRFGELGPYQFRPTTWRMHTRKPFRLAADRATADEVAAAHYEWIKQKLQAAGVRASAYNIAMAWNSGVDNVINGRAPNVSYNYAERVVNLVHAFKRRARSSAAAGPEPTSTPAPSLLASLPLPSLELDKPAFHFPTIPDAPKFDIVVAAAAPEPIVYTHREDPAVPVAPEARKDNPFFVVSTTATLTPRFTLFPSLTD